MLTWLTDAHGPKPFDRPVCQSAIKNAGHHTSAGHVHYYQHILTGYARHLVVNGHVIAGLDVNASTATMALCCIYAVCTVV